MRDDQDLRTTRYGDTGTIPICKCFPFKFEQRKRKKERKKEENIISIVLEQSRRSSLLGSDSILLFVGK